MICPSCGREIPDDVDICPYCTANLKRRVEIKKIYIIALILIVVGASYASLAYASSEIPITKISDLGIDDNYKFVHVRGVVVDYPRVYESEYGVSELLITISDGTDELTVKVYRDLINKVVDRNKVPGLGDTVDAQGIFSYTTRKTLTVNEVKNLKVIRGTYNPVSIRNIVNAAPWALREEMRVEVRGNITSVREYSFGYIATLDDLLDVVVPRSYVSLNLVDFGDMGSGIVKIYGVLKFYRPNEPSSSYQEVNLSKVMKNPENYNSTNVDIRWATVVEKNEDENTLIISANGTQVQVYVGYGVKYYAPGEHVEIAGKFINYRGKWEIKVTRKADFVSEPKWEIVMHPEYKIVERKEYKNSYEMSIFELRNITGVVADYSETGGGLLITLWSENKSYSVYVESTASIHGTITYGVNVTVKGMVTMYRGSYEIKVRAFTHDLVEVRY